MALSDVFKSAAVTAFSAFDDIPKAVTYVQSSGNAVYDTATATATLATINHPLVDVIFATWKADQVDGEVILKTDIRAYIPSEFLSFTPTVHDFILYDGKRLNVVNKKIDPAGAMWDIQLREP